MRWTKRDLYRSSREIARVIEARRLDVVLSGLRSFRATLRERGERSRETSSHFEANPSIYGNSTPEMIERFARLATEDLAAANRLDGLIARIESVGLPEELRDYPDRVKFL